LRTVARRGVKTNAALVQLTLPALLRRAGSFRKFPLLQIVFGVPRGLGSQRGAGCGLALCGVDGALRRAARAALR